MHLKNKTNSYQRNYPNFDKTPKAVVAAVAFSFALQLCDDDFAAAEKMVAEEWGILADNRIVPQKPRAKQARAA